MLTKFWDKIAENLAQESQRLVLRSTPAFVFWAGGAVLYAMQEGWQTVLDQISAWNAAQAITAVVVLVAILAISSTLMTQFTVPMLRWLEGYWRRPFAGLAGARIHRTNQKINRKEERWNELAQLRKTELTPAQVREYAQLDADLAAFPVNEAWRMPTRLGNLIRSAEEYPGSHYGLEINITWPRLWLLLPESAQKEVARSRQNLDRAVQIFAWAVLFCAWGFLNPWAVLIGILLAAIFYQTILQSAGAYGELLKSAYDLYRFRLYEAIYWPKPQNPEAEAQSGAQLTNYLHRAEAGSNIQFNFPERE